MATPDDFDFDLAGVVVAWGANFSYTLRDGRNWSALLVTATYLLVHVHETPVISDNFHS